MKKIFLLLILFMILSGCANSITKEYPDAANDFLESDYSQLKELARDGMSYQELCQKFIENNLNDELYSIVKNISEEAIINNIKCNKKEDEFKITYNVSKDSEEAIINIITDPENYNLKNITISIVTSEYYQILRSLIESIDDGKYIFIDVYRNITRELNVDNKIYYQSKKYFYLPLENKEIRIYKYVEDIDKSYQSQTEYWEKDIKQNEEDIKELEDNLNKVEENINNINESYKSSVN